MMPCVKPCWTLAARTLGIDGDDNGVECVRAYEARMGGRARGLDACPREEAWCRADAAVDRRSGRHES